MHQRQSVKLKFAGHRRGSLYCSVEQQQGVVGIDLTWECRHLGAQASLPAALRNCASRGSRQGCLRSQVP